MIRGFEIDMGRLRPVAEPLADSDGVAWFDLVSPTEAEERAVEALIGAEVPTPEEMEEIEDSSRLYLDQGASFMTAMIPSRTESGRTVQVPVTFILAGPRLVTVRYDAVRAFETFPQRAERIDLGCSDGETVLLALLDAVIERLADILETCAKDIDGLSHEIFRKNAVGTLQDSPDYQQVLKGVGRQGDVLSHVLAGLVTLERLVAFHGAVGAAGKDLRIRLKSLARDTRFLSDHATFLAQKVNFLLDATLGMISIQQNAIIKIFSVAAVIFLPPTLVASIYGMNFDIMPELHWVGGYPMALGLMLASAAVSYWVFKTKGWL